MTAPVLDHVVLDVHDRMDAAVQTYQRLGFHMTERGFHTLGSINHLAIFATDYLELLGWDPAKPGRAELAGFAPGLNGLVFKTDSADATQATMQAAGVPVQAAQSFSRPVRLGGAAHDAKFRTTHVDPAAVPFGRLYVCQHDTPELVWRTEWQDHPNGVRAIAGLLIAAEDPGGLAGLFARVFGTDTVSDIGGGAHRLGASGVPIDIVPPARATAELGADAPEPRGRPAWMAALRLRTASLARAAQVLSGTARRTDGGLRIPAAAACNVTLDFAERTG
ncbi:MAG: VOC family protein [Acidisphaera sp.]|nr:VOC family protein [Acidisphaera sp.]